jgi:molybdopterin molybdotransferase
MISVKEAQEIVLKHTQPLPPRTASLSEAALGLVLAEPVAADRDMPPFDKALMDGYAVRAEDLRSDTTVLHVIEEILAGQSPRQALSAGQSARIMTGAPMPPGADAVVMVEKTRLLDASRVEIADRPTPGRNMLPRGREMRRGEVILRSETVLGPQELGLLAAVGKTEILLNPAPTVAILPTGDEIVAASECPGPAQLRNSNGPMLAAQVRRAGGIARELGIARDQVEHLRQLIGEGLKTDVLVLCGGVSAGKRDLVPAVLDELGVEALFHKVAMKPGKPVLFGVKPRDGNVPVLVFGLPGNPVSALVCFELFVRPALRRLQNKADPGPFFIEATLDRNFPSKGDRPTYHPAFLQWENDGWRVRPAEWFGSPDLRGLIGTNAFIVFPPGEHLHQAGQRFSVLKVE